jgi:hypothetical protein
MVCNRGPEVEGIDPRFFEVDREKIPIGAQQVQALPQKHLAEGYALGLGPHNGRSPENPGIPDYNFADRIDLEAAPSAGARLNPKIAFAQGSGKIDRSFVRPENFKTASDMNSVIRIRHTPEMHEHSRVDRAGIANPHFHRVAWHFVGSAKSGVWSPYYAWEVSRLGAISQASPRHGAAAPEGSGNHSDEPW